MTEKLSLPDDGAESPTRNPISENISVFSSIGWEFHNERLSVLGPKNCMTHDVCYT